MITLCMMKDWYHTPARYVGEKLLVKSTFADDEKNTETQTVLVLHLGGLDGLSHLTGIHGIHLGHIEYIATDPTRATIPWVQRRNPEGTETVFSTSAQGGPVPQGELLNDKYASEAEAQIQIPQQLAAFYRTQYPEVLKAKAAQVKSAGDELVTLYNQNVFPFMKVTWGTHPNNIGHT